MAHGREKRLLSPLKRECKLSVPANMLIRWFNLAEGTRTLGIFGGIMTGCLLALTTREQRGLIAMKSILKIMGGK